MTKREINKKTSELAVFVTAKKDEWEQAQKKAFTELQKKLKLPGFRPGKVTELVAKKHIKDVQIWNEAALKMLDILVKEAAKEIKKDELVLAAPMYNISKLSASELEVAFIYPLYPEVVLAKYKGLGIKIKPDKVRPEELKQDLDNLLRKHSILSSKKGVAEKGDVAKFDFEGFIGEKAFEGGKSKNYELELGSGQFIPGFEEQMLGLKAGDKKDVKVTFPKDYHSKDLAGQPAVFKVKLNEIKSKETPKKDDDFAKEVGIPNVKTFKELEQYIEKQHIEKHKQDAKAKFQKEIFEKLVENSKFVVPTSLLVSEMERIQKQFEQQLAQQGLDLKKYMEFTKMKEEQLKAQISADARKNIENSIIFAEIAKAEKIEITEKDYEAEYEKLAKVYKQPVDEVKKVITKAQIQVPLTNTKVIEKLIELNK